MEPKPNAKHNDTCKHCRAPFYRRSGSTRNYCSNGCKKALNRADKKAKAPKPTKAEKDLANFWGSGLAQLMTDYCERAGTSETYRGATADDLIDFAELTEYRRTRYGYDASRKVQQFPICHVQPIKGESTVGLSYGCNVFVGLQSRNSGFGNRTIPSSAGRSIPRASLKRSLLIEEGEPIANIRAKLIKVLGKELDRFLSRLEKPLRPASNVAIAGRVYRRQGTDREVAPLSRLYTLEELKKRDYDELLELDAIQTGRLDEYLRDKHLGVQRFGTCTPDSDLGVLYDSLQRFVRILPNGEHRDNCVAMLPLVHTFGIYLGQIPFHPEVKHGRWSVPNTDWSPLKWEVTRLGQLEDRDLERRLISADNDHVLRKHFKAVAYDTLQGLRTGFRIRNTRRRLHDHLDLVALAPMPVVDAYSKPLEDFAYTLTQCRQHWKALESSQLVSVYAVADAPAYLALNTQTAIERARSKWLKATHPPRHHQGRFHEHWGWKGNYPDYLEIPTLDALLAAA